MEVEGVRVERRGKKRKVKDVPSVVEEGEGRRRAVETRSRALVGQYVKKKCEDSEVLFGKVMFYDRGFYKIHYETGVCEELGGSEVRRYLVGDDDFDDELVFKRNKLDEIVLKKYAKGDDVKVGTTVELTKDVEGGETLSMTKLSSSGGTSVKKGIQVGIVDADSSCDSCELAHGGAFRFDAEASVVSPPELPPSSSNLGVPDECVPGLLSTYSFLRSFSIRLFLSPFELEDFVESLKCLVKNSLLDAIHVALMRALWRNFLSLSSNGSELASKLLRSMDWSLIDALTWPTFLVQYLLMMGYTDKHEMEGFYVDILQRDYYYVSVGRKLAILQILCDDALDCEELRVEIDMGGGHEFGIDCEATVAASENGPRRVHTRYLKTSPCKDQEAMGIITDSCATKSFLNSISLEDKSTTTDANADVHDGNGDECRLCGMDGTLLCCDGCPSVYHSRCIGVIRMSIPHGKWYCPECTINNIGPSITMYTSLRGGELFGVDPYEQVFMGTCNHLMVLKMSVTSETCIRYYHQKDIPRVLQALYSSPHHINSYSGLCNAIIKYWRIPLDVTFFDEKVELDTKLASEKEDSWCPTQSLALLGKSNSPDFLDLVESEKFTSCVTESSSGNMTISCLGSICDEPGINKASLDTLTQSKHHVCQLVNNDYATEQTYSLRNASSSEKIKLEPTMSSSSVSQKNDPTKSTQQEFGLKSELRGFASYTSGNSDSGNRVHVKHSCGAANMSSQGKLDNCPVSERDYKDLRSSLKAQSYINNYINGDFAASAAANLAMLSSGENSDSKLNALDNYRKVMLLQIKAFSSAVSRFFWPNSQKKLVEVPRERCGWCLSCKDPVQSKKACLLNASALNVTRGTMRTLADIRPVKNKEGSLYAIAAYVMFMEKSLHGLTAGPFQSQTYRERWRKRAEQTLTCSEIKNLLLELEENIRTIAFNGDWFKLVDGWSTEPSVTDSTSTASQKREPGRRRGRKQSVIPEVTDDDKRGISKSFIWWRGGILSKLIFQKGILPRTIIKQSARQGGCRKITSIYYGEGVQVPKRNRRFAWKVAVELSKNTSQLALQIRYLDTHVRWGDLVHPEQTPLDGKGTDTEVHAFRNAVICQKQNVENKIKYAVSFGSQKHLPSRVLKNVLEVEKSEDGFEKYWFLETRVPLYMIKDYEENIAKLSLPPAEKPVNVSSKLHIRQLQASRKDIFSYLSRRRDKLDMCRCAYCQMDVFLGNAVNCSICKGYCHVQCTVSSTVHVVEGFEFLITCKSCHQTEAFMQNENKAIISSHVLLQKQEPKSAIIISRAGKRNGPKRHRASNGASDSSSVSSKEVNKRNWGLVWKKENEVGGIDFRLNHILLKGNRNAVEIVCYLCKKPYNPDLMYIHCGTCERWYHADAVELEESRILELLGFKCFKCRKTKSPDCPYVDQVKKVVLEGQNLRKTPPKQASLAVDLSAKSFDVQFKATECATIMLSVKEESVCLEGDDPSVSSLLGVEHDADPTTEVEPKWNCECQELSVKRQAKQGNCITCSSVNNPRVDSSTLLVGNTFHAADETSSHSVEWNVPTDVSEAGLMVDSLSSEELLVSDHVGVELDGVDKSGAKIEYLENSSIILLEGGQPKQADSLPEAVHVVPCRICYSKEPSPDRCCEICGIWMHSHCSPLSEGSSGKLSWRCSNCREWQ